MNRISNQYNEIKDNQEHLEELIHNEQIQRLNSDKKTNLMNENLNSEINNIKKLISHFENINNILNNDFISIKNDINNQVEELMLNLNKNFLKLQNESLNEINDIKNQKKKFHMNIIQENQKFINYNQDQLKNQSSNIKQLFEYNNNDIDVLKKKSETLESVIRNLRNEMENNINNVEAYLSEKCDELFKNFNQERMINC